MSHHHHYNLIWLAVQTALVNTGSYILMNYDKVLGAGLTFLTICYYIWKWRQEYLKSKKVEK